MTGSTSDNVLLADLAKAEEQGLDTNRLLFVRYLVLSKRLTDELDARTREVPTLQAA